MKRSLTDRQREAKVLKRVAKKLGFRFSPHQGSKSPAQVQGDLQGRPIRVWGRVLEDEPYGMALRVGIAPPLDLGLDIQRRGAVSAIAQSFREQSDFELKYVVDADEPARAAALLVPGLRTALDASHAKLTDEDVSFGVYATGASGTPIARRARNVLDALDEAMRISDLVDEAREHVPPALRLVGYAEAWASLAKRYDLRALNTPVRLAGKVGATELLARAKRTGKEAFSVTVSARLDTPLGVRVQVRPAGWIDKVRAVFRPDIQLADATFDRCFQVKSEKPDIVRYLLNGDLRQRLLSMNRAGVMVQLDDTGATLVFASDAISPEESVEAIGLALAVCDRMRESVATGGGRRAYR